ncbi:MAG TPA: peptide chain release factor N(5)-glutamine methyltransferase [Gemmatimonadota bacterium]|nr:peptide chain release factor N(5)-glutamine methyltransferase [Gemmatimonadota bacterium]
MVRDDWSVLAILRTTTSFLEERGVSEPRLSAEHLLADVLDCRRLDLYLRFDRPLSPDEVESYRSRVRRRLAGEPVQYITGVAGFRGLELAVDPRVLVPRPETERLVAEVLEWARAKAARGAAPAAGWRILDLGTGSGAIACALALELEGARLVVGSDRSRPALEVARANAARVGAGRVAWVEADGLSAFRVAAAFDAIVCNPPYVAETDRSALPAEVRDWEPAEALFAGPEGTEAIARVVREAPEHLAADGLLAIEIGDRQEPAVRRMVEQVPALELLGGYQDHAGRARGILALATRREG